MKYLFDEIQYYKMFCIKLMKNYIVLRLTFSVLSSIS